MKTSVSGFTIVRNLTRLNYPFSESVLSVLPLCDEFIINCGESDDDSFDVCLKLQNEHPQIKVITSKWEKGGEDGYQLKQQTDFALKHCQRDWCFYIQADEVIHEEDFEKLNQAIELSNQHESIDGVLFDYVHFYGGFNHTIEGRSWYRCEVRLFKNRRNISAFRDAQGFRKFERRLKVVESGARVFHYGYVRSADSTQKKSVEMSRWWNTENKTNKLNGFKPVRHIGLKKFLGQHPKIMHEFIIKNHISFDPEKLPRRWDRSELKNLITLFWESLFNFRIGEFKNYDLKRCQSTFGPER